MDQFLRRLFLEPSLRGLQIDDPAVLEVHKRVLTKKGLLKSAYNAFYSVAAREFGKVQGLSGVFIELGSGVGFIKQVIPYVITSDVRMDPNPDVVLDATNLDLADSSVAGFFAINVFHHLPEPRQFFSELDRTLTDGGVCVLIEPHKGALSKFVHSRVHKDEFFDLGQIHWEQPEATGALSEANQALSDIVFGRDRELFELEFGDSLKISHAGYVANQLRFLTSGGLNYRQMLPNWTSGILTALEWSMSKMGKHLSLHQVWIIQKKSKSSSD
jgi:SAM-dependent methyltransferase